MTISRDITGFSVGEIEDHLDSMLSALYWFSENGDFLDKEGPSYRLPGALSEIEKVRLHGCLSIACHILRIDWES